MSQPGPTSDETRAVVERYARRNVGDRYSALHPEVWQTLHERQAALLRLWVARGITDLSGLRLAEVGCGSGGNLLELLRLGFAPEHLTGLELLPERLAQARHVLPVTVQLLEGDATQAAIGPGSQDIVFVSTVFSSLLDDAFQQDLAAQMWHWLRPGGAVLWYDFTVNNPRNPDVRGVPLARVAQLFPAARMTHRRVTLAPPLARLVCRVHPALYRVFNALPLLRTHRLAWLEKPGAG
jgi:SAM-dependent methyltransferase